MPDKYRFCKTSRLLKKKDFDAVLRRGKRLFGSYFSLCFQPTQSDKTRLGIIMRKPIIRLAVNRNRAKRMVREAFRLRQDQLQGLDVVVISLKNNDEAGNLELLACLNRLFDKVIEQREGSH